MKPFRLHAPVTIMLTLALLVACGRTNAQVRAVNMISHSLSSETQQDGEVWLAVNPANPSQIAGSAFTPDPLDTTFSSGSRPARLTNHPLRSVKEFPRCSPPDGASCAWMITKTPASCSPPCSGGITTPNP